MRTPDTPQTLSPAVKHMVMLLLRDQFGPSFHAHDLLDANARHTKMAIELSHDPSTVTNLVIPINNPNVLSDTEGQDTEEEAIEGEATEGEDSGEEE
jgi:hypothetical protein